MSNVPRPSQLFPEFRAGHGFTLIEVLVAMAIIAIALVALLGSQARSIGRAGETAFLHLAPVLAANKLAEVEGGLVPSLDGAGDFAPERPEYRWQLKVADPPVGTSERLRALTAFVRRVEVVVSRDGSPHSYALVAYIGRARTAGSGEERR